MKGKKLFDAAFDGDTATVGTLLSSAGAQSSINYQEAGGFFPLYRRPKLGMRPSQNSLL